MLQYKSYNRAAITHPGYVFSILGFAMLFGLISSILVSPLLNLLIADEAYKLFTEQILVSILTLLLPVWLTEQYYRRKNFTHVYRVNLRELKGNDFIYGVILLLCMIPITSFSSYIMNMIPIPAPLQEIITEAQAIMDKTYELFLYEKRPLGIMLSLLSVVIIAPITEEYFFRGGLQGWMLSNIKNVHISIWIIAFFFGIIHMQWSGILSRILLGAIIGYSALYGSIGLAILVHFLNNLFAFVLAQITGNENFPEPSSAIEIVRISLLFILAAFIAIKVFQRMKAENITEEFIKENIEDQNYED